MINLHGIRSTDEVSQVLQILAQKLEEHPKCKTAHGITMNMLAERKLRRETVRTYLSSPAMTDFHKEAFKDA